MTNLEIAQAVALVPMDELGELAGLIFDEIEKVHTPEEFQEIYDILQYEGVDVDRLCKRKHPPAPG